MNVRPLISPLLAGIFGALVTVQIQHVWMGNNPARQARPPVDLTNAARGRQNRVTTVAPTTIPIKESPRRGDASAHVAMIIYSDFQCPYCAKFERDTMPLINAEFVKPGRMSVVFKHLPLQGIHGFSFPAAKAAVCAQGRGKFWELHDLLFSDTSIRSIGTLANRSRAIGLNPAELTACTSESTTAMRVMSEAAEARQLGLSGTPGFALGYVQRDSVVVTKRISGALPFGEFKEAISALVGPASE